MCSSLCRAKNFCEQHRHFFLTLLACGLRRSGECRRRLFGAVIFFLHIQRRKQFPLRHALYLHCASSALSSALGRSEHSSFRFIVYLHVPPRTLMMLDLISQPLRPSAGTADTPTLRPRISQYFSMRFARIGAFLHKHQSRSTRACGTPFIAENLRRQTQRPASVRVRDTAPAAGRRCARRQCAPSA